MSATSLFHIDLLNIIGWVYCEACARIYSVGASIVFSEGSLCLFFLARTYTQNRTRKGFSMKLDVFEKGKVN